MIRHYKARVPQIAAPSCSASSSDVPRRGRLWRLLLESPYQSDRRGAH
jgi:hypothetical protein